MAVCPAKGLVSAKFRLREEELSEGFLELFSYLSQGCSYIFFFFRLKSERLYKGGNSEITQRKFQD